MKQRPRPDWLRERLRVGRRGQQMPTAPVRRRRVSRREREARKKRQLYWGMAVAGSLVVLILAIFAVNDYVIKPRHVLASVEDTKIRRNDYWKVRSLDLINQASQYQQFATFAQDANQQTQYQSFAQQALAELENVWGSTDVDDSTLSRMIEDQIYLQRMDDLEVSVTQEDINSYLDQQFAPQDAPIFTPTPSPTLIPERAAWATQTAEAAVSPTPGAGSPSAGGATPITSPGVGAPVAMASPIASPDAVQAEAASPVASPAANASAEGTREATPILNQEQAIQTAAANYEQYRDAVFEETHMSRGDYERLIVRPAVARQEVRSILEADVGQTAEQVHASHILVGTQDLADSIYDQVTAEDANFEQIAQEQSTDTSTAPNGGDLGWFTRGTMVDEFEEVAFSLPPGQISEPFRTQFGWHIVKSYAHESDRPMTDEQITRVKESRVQEWLDEQRESMDISSELEPTPTPASEEFVPPPDAPPLPTPTPQPLGSPSPVGSPAIPDASPVASPAASPAT